MFVAAMLAAAAVCDDVTTVIETGLDEIPEKSRGKFGMGHYSAARSLAQQIEEKFPQSQVRVVDFLEYALPELSRTIYRGFELLVNRGTGFYNRVYHITDNGRIGNRPFFQRYLLGKMGELIFQTKPTVLLSTLPLCSQLVSCYKKRYSDSLPLVTCITDVTSHCEWINDFTDCYLVASPSVRRQLVAKGVKEERICVGGIPRPPLSVNSEQFG